MCVCALKRNQVVIHSPGFINGESKKVVRTESHNLIPANQQRRACSSQSQDRRKETGVTSLVKLYYIFGGRGACAFSCSVKTLQEAADLFCGLPLRAKQIHVMVEFNGISE